jgi:hypothetical protein
MAKIRVFHRKITLEGNGWGEAKIIEAQSNKVHLSFLSKEDTRQ